MLNYTRFGIACWLLLWTWLYILAIQTQESIHCNWILEQNNMWNCFVHVCIGKHSILQLDKITHDKTVNIIYRLFCLILQEGILDLESEDSDDDEIRALKAQLRRVKQDQRKYEYADDMDDQSGEEDEEEGWCLCSSLVKKTFCLKIILFVTDFQLNKI